MKQFPLFQSHLDLAHHYWRTLIKPGDTVIDATCGNGCDSLVLALAALQSDQGKLIAFDKQKEAINNTSQLLKKHLTLEQLSHIQLVHGCHSHFPSEIEKCSVKLIVYNLGYLPGGDKEVTTMRETTLSSIEHALELITPGGGISITCYPGHPAGFEEEEALSLYTASLNPFQWSICHHRWINRKKAPNLLLIQKKETL